MAGDHTHYKGFFDVFDSFEKALVDFDPEVVVFDCNDFAAEMMKCCALDIPYIGCSQGALLEGNLPMAMKMLKQNDVKVVPYTEYETASKAADSLKGDDFTNRLLRLRMGPNREWVILTGSSEETEDRLEFITRAYKKQPVIVQDLGVAADYSIFGFFNGKTWMEPGILQIRDEETCCDVSTIRSVDTKSKLWGVTLKKISLMLKSLKYVGMVGMNFRVDHETSEVRVYELLCGLKAVTAQAFCFGLNQDLGSFLKGLACGNVTDYDFVDGYVTGSQVSIPPHPVNHLPWLTEEKEKAVLPALLFPSIGITAEPPENSQPDKCAWMWGQVSKKSSSSKVITNGPLLGVAVGKDSDAEMAKSRADYIGHNITVPGRKVQSGTLFSDTFDTLERMKLIRR